MADNKAKEFSTRFEDYNKIDVDESGNSQFILKFIAAMDKSGAMKKIDKNSIQDIKTLLKFNKYEYDLHEIFHIWKLVKSSMDNTKDSTSETTLIISKADAIAKLNKKISDENISNYDLNASLKLLADFSGWSEDKDTEKLIESNDALMATLNKLFTITEQEHLAFNLCDEEIAIENSVDEELEDSSSMDRIEIQ